MGERNFTRLTSSTTAYVLSHFGDTHTHGHTHVRATQSPLEWFVTLMALPFFWVGGGTFNCLVIVSMLSVSQSIKPH